MRISFQNIIRAALSFVALTALAPSASAQGGVPLWTNRYSASFETNISVAWPRAMAVDKNGNVYVTGESWNSSDNDFATVAYSNLGTPLWTNRYDGGYGDDGPRDITVDRSGNIFVTGYSTGDGGVVYYATVAYSSAGLSLWTNRYGGGSSNDNAFAVRADNKGTVIVTGRSSNGVDSDYATIAYSNAGVPLWTNRYERGSSLDEAFAVAVDNNGKVFVTGRSFGSDFVYNYVTIAYSDLGLPLWTNLYGAGEGWASAVDAEGNIFVTGYPATIKYSSAGLPLWTNWFDHTGNGIVVAGNGDVFVTGTDYATVAYSNAGVPVWTNRFNGFIPYLRQEIVADSNGNAFVTGTSSANGQYYQATVGYSGDGVPLWTNIFKEKLNGYADARAIAIDSSGNVFVAAGSSDGTNNDYVTIKYSSSIPPARLDFQKLNNQLVLSWTNAGFNLQSAASVSGTFTNLPNATSPYTNSFTAPRQFFRLISN